MPAGFVLNSNVRPAPFNVSALLNTSVPGAPASTGLICAPAAAVTLPFTAPLPPSVWFALRPKPPLTAETSNSVLAASRSAVELDNDPVAASRNVPALTAVLPL